MRIAVIGAGLQGACIAMELALAGQQVDLYDKNSTCVSQASANNEGKIHLGYVYANDASLSTARAMIRGAAAFAPLMRRWIGSDIDGVPVSTPFYYLVHRQSMLTLEHIEAHFAAVHEMALEHGPHVDYFGADFRIPASRISRRECDSLFDPRTVAAALRTTEIAIDPEILAAKVRSRLGCEPNIRCIMDTLVHKVDRDENEVRIHFMTGGSSCSEAYDHVINAAWDGRLALDETAGIRPARTWIYRVKHYLRIRSSTELAIPSATMILGAFGDTVGYNGRDFYLSWYPVAMRGASRKLVPPSWPLVLDRPTQLDLRQRMISALAGIVTPVGRLTAEAIESWQIRGGIIFAWGQTDIDDPASVLHQRHAIGPQSFGRYHTVDTGKLTTAPLFAKQLANRILGRN